MRAAARFIAISGCSGGGKSTLLAELARRGFAVAEEPGRRVIAEAQGSGADVLPWENPLGFARAALAMARADRAAAEALEGPVFFDRGVIDALAALRHCGAPDVEGEAMARGLYGRRAFLTPPWREIFVGDAGRRHGFDEAVGEYERLRGFYPALGYEVEILPKAPVERRADILLSRLRAR